MTDTYEVAYDDRRITETIAAPSAHCDFCGCPLDRNGDPALERGGTHAAIFQRMAWEFRNNPVKTMIVFYRVTDSGMTLQAIADAITSVVAQVHNRKPMMTRQAVMHHIRRICDDFGDDTITDILQPRKGKR
jgi:hypothetical protein